MTQKHLDQAVARATGETLATVRRLGFGLTAARLTCPRRKPSRPPGRAARRHAPA